MIQVKNVSETAEKQRTQNAGGRGGTASFGETAKKVANRRETGAVKECGGDKEALDAARAQERRERLERMQERRRRRMEELRLQELRRKKRELQEREYEQRRLIRKLRLKAYTEKMLLKKVDDRQRMEERNAKIALARATHGRLPVDKRVRAPRVISVKPAYLFGRVKLF